MITHSMLMVFLSLGGPRGGATLKRINYREIDMEIDDKTPFGRKLDYLKLSLYSLTLFIFHIENN